MSAEAHFNFCGVVKKQNDRLQRVMDNMRKRIVDCIQNECGHLSNVIF